MSNSSNRKIFDELSVKNKKETYGLNFTANAHGLKN